MCLSGSKDFNEKPYAVGLQLLVAFFLFFLFLLEKLQFGVDDELFYSLQRLSAVFLHLYHCIYIWACVCIREKQNREKMSS